MKSETERHSSRWFAQKWVLDNTVALLGPEAVANSPVQSTFSAIGNDAATEAQALRSRVKRFADIGREFRRLAIRREELARQAEGGSHAATARDNYFAAALFYGAARWSIMEDENPALAELNSKMTECYQKYILLADHPIERVEIPFDGFKIYGYFHRPNNTGERFSTVVSLTGMDGFKEQSVRLYGDKLLARNFAVFAFDGPGQGEAVARGLKVKPDSFDRVAKELIEYLTTRKDVAHEKIALRGSSFGTYWGPRMMASDSRYRVGSFSSVCHEPRGSTIFNSAHPAYKLRHMWMAGYEDEEEFENSYCSKLSLAGIGEKIRQPVLIAAGDSDPLSPIEYTCDFYRELAGPKRLLIYEGQGHGITNPQLSNTVGDFLLDALSGAKIESGIQIVDQAGRSGPLTQVYTPV